MADVYCDYCGTLTDFVDSKVIYGRSYGMAYLCPNCKAYVGVHKGTDKPLGRLANAELRKWKNAAHASFDPLWQTGPFRRKRNQAYAWLSKQMGLPIEKTHIGMFDIAECKQVIKICTEITMKGGNFKCPRTTKAK